jgi:hypothetical protein
MVAALEALERGKVGYTVKSASTTQMPIPTGVRLRLPEVQTTSISRRDSKLESLFYAWWLFFIEVFCRVTRVVARA